MKKGLLVMLAVVLLCGLVGPVFSQAMDKKVELEKVKHYISVLNDKIEKARQANQPEKVKALKAEKDKQLARAAALKAQITQPAKQAISSVDKIGQRGWQVAGGYGGGGALLEVGYVFPIRPAFKLVVDAGVGLGNQYSIIVGKVYGVINDFWGIGVDMANYSQSVAGIPGISGNVSQGSRIGGEVFVLPKFGSYQTQIGYSTSLGVTAGVVFKL